MTLTDWTLMTVAEPALLALERDIEHFAATTGVRDEWDLEKAWVYQFKPRMETPVGWKCPRPCLQTAAAYHVVYRRLYSRLMAVLAPPTEVSA